MPFRTPPVGFSPVAGLPDPGTRTSTTTTGLKAGTAYRVQVRAGNASVEGAWSDSGSATTNAAANNRNSFNESMSVSDDSYALFLQPWIGFTHFD